MTALQIIGLLLLACLFTFSLIWGIRHYSHQCCDNDCAECYPPEEKW